MRTIGVGGSTAAQELAKLSDMTADVRAIGESEYKARLEQATRLLKDHNLQAMYINAGTNLYYFTGTRWWPSERMVGAVLTAKGELYYIVPHFEIDTMRGFMQIKGEVLAWQEHECPYQLFAQSLIEREISSGRIGIDESTPFFISDGLAQANDKLEYVSAKSVTAGCRMRKSPEELALLQRAKDMTLEVQKAAARILYVGIRTQEVTQFIHQAHKAVGASSGSYFCIVLFGADSAFPHGVKQAKNLEEGDMVLIDTGCQLEGYNSDITRSYVFGEPTPEQRRVWQVEKDAQAEAFAAAQLGAPCGTVDLAARKYLSAQGFGPDYELPGLPHRTGHGIGLDIHEWPYLVASDTTPLAQGMCFSNEPMICVPGQFGIRLEDHFYMSEQGAKWFTQPSHSIDDPFGYESNI